MLGPGPHALALGLEADPPAPGGGAGYHYSQLAALIVETATGQTVAELLDARIVEPLGVEDTTIAPPGRRDPLHWQVIRPPRTALGDARGRLTTLCVSCNLRLVKTYADPMDALGDPTRRRIFERLAEGPASVGTLADGMPVSRPAVSQHLRVLKDAGLVSDRQVGTRRIYAVDPAGVVALREYWDRLWSRALDGFRVAAEELASGRERGAQRRESNDGEGS